MDFLTKQEEMAIRRFKAEVERICGAGHCDIRLFGSRARQSGNEESDVDLLVLLDDYSEEKKVKIWDAAYSIFSETEILLSPMVLSKEFYENLKKRERLIAKEIESDGITI